MDEVTVEVAGDEVTITHPDKVMFPDQGWTKLDVVEHYLTCIDGALAGVFGRPTMLKRWPRGVGEKPFFQKRAPKSATERHFVEFPSGRTAGYLVPRTPYDVIWMVQLKRHRVPTLVAPWGVFSITATGEPGPVAQF